MKKRTKRITIGVVIVFIALIAFGGVLGQQARENTLQALSEGSAALAEQNWGVAVEAYSTALRESEVLDPADEMRLEAQMGIASALAMQGKNEEAINRFVIAFQTNPQATSTLDTQLVRDASSAAKSLIAIENREASLAELEGRVRSVMAGGFMESGITEEEIRDLRIYSRSEGMKISFNFDTDEWTGIFKRGELHNEMESILVPIHRMVLEIPEISEVVVKIWSPASARRDEFGNEIEENPMVHLLQLNIPAEDLRKFSSDKVGKGPVYVASRYASKFLRSFKKDYEWDSVVAEEKKLWF